MKTADDSPSPLQRAVDLIGGQRATANVLNISQGMVWQWLNARRPLPPEHCWLIELATAERGDTVTCEELAPGVVFQRDASGRVTGYIEPVLQPKGEGGEIDPDADRVEPLLELP